MKQKKKSKLNIMSPSMGIVCVSCVFAFMWLYLRVRHYLRLLWGQRHQIENYMVYGRSSLRGENNSRLYRQGVLVNRSSFKVTTSQFPSVFFDRVELDITM